MNLLSDCCGAPEWFETGLCSDCKEHTEFLDYDELESEDYLNYRIQLNENYYPAHPQSKFIYWNTEDYDEPIGNGATIEECKELINERLDQL